jgi:hypothetical protein
MSDPFDSPRRTLRRAKQHVEDFYFRTIAFRNERNWAYIADKDAHGRAKSHKIKFEKTFFDDAPSIAKDAITNLRDVLDQIGYASAVASGKSAPKQAKFPFGDDPTGLQNVIDRKGSSDLPPKILSLFCGFKPYKTGNPLLWGLNKLANTKKHAMLIPVQLGGSGGFAVDLDGVIISFNYRWNAEEREIEILGQGANLDLSDQKNFAFDITFDHVEHFNRGSEAVALLSGMASEVQRVLMATEAECRRLGFIK